MFTKEQIVEYFQKEAERPLNKRELAERLGLETPEEKEELRAVLKELTEEYKLVRGRKKRYGLPEQLHMRIGVLSRNPKGFGFVRTENPEEDDIYVRACDLGTAMNGDTVLIQINREANYNPVTESFMRAEGEILEVLERKTSRVVGTFHKSKYFGFVVPDDKRFGGDIFIPKEFTKHARTGMKVVAVITSWPEGDNSAEGVVTQILGMENDPGVDILSIIEQNQLPSDFPLEVLEAAEAIPEVIPREEVEKRRDLRDTLMITIDGEDAKDLDDAVSVEKLENGNYFLGVHIADVGHYVTENSILDKEAVERATSIYLVDRVIPMLPKKLSNGVCSLNAGEDRLALSALMEVDAEGTVVNHEIVESIIRVNYRMNYKQVTKMLEEQDEKLCGRYAEILPMIQQMAELQKILEEKRVRRGAITFNAPESKVILNEKNQPIRIEWRTSGIADKMIEEFMICANETVAEHYYWMEVPFLYRVHEEPKTESVTEVNQFLQAMGYKVKGANKEVHAKAYQIVLEKVAGKPEEQLVNTVLLRSMQHARYDTTELGHFGLSAKYYSHFTSPIRRYPDLAIHRVIKELMHNGEVLNQDRIDQLSENMEYYAKQSSEREKVAEEAERDSVSLKKVEYMLPFVGKVFEGTISGVTGFGFFVQLENSVEGLVHISTLSDYYEFDQKSYSLRGSSGKKCYQLGQKVRVKLARVSKEDRQIDFTLAEKNE